LDPQHAWASCKNGNNQQALADFEMCLALGAREDAEKMIGTLLQPPP
jgi:hypothetical protein